MELALKEILAEEPDLFQAIQKFYRRKHAIGWKGLFSCSAAEQFPKGWLKACETGIWNEEGLYGDNFRQVFNLKKSNEKHDQTIHS